MGVQSPDQKFIWTKLKLGFMKNERFYSGASKYNFERSLKKHRDVLTEDDERLIRRYIDEMQAINHITESRARKIGFALVGWRRFITVPWNSVTMEDIYHGITAMKNGNSSKGKPLKTNSMHDFMSILKPFLRWLSDKKITSISKQDIKENIKPVKANTETVAAADLITMQEIEALIKAASSVRDRALVSTLYESGVRVGELGSITWRDVIFDEYGVKLYITDTKTSKRRYSRLTTSTESLAALKNHYPGTPEGEAFVFLNVNRKPMTYIGIYRTLQRLAKRAEIKKDVRPHLFRHSRITHMINQNYQESVIKKSLWGNLSTNMFKTYVSLSEADIDTEFLKRAGIKVSEKDPKDQPLRPRTCERCHTINSSISSYCNKCGLPLTEDALASLSDAEKAAELLPEYKAILENVKAQLEKMQAKKEDA